METLKHKIKGPVIPLPTPFTEAGEVDIAALEKYVKFLVANGIRNVMTTVGTSRFNLLTYDEVKSVNAAVVRAAAGQATTIVANPQYGSLQHANDFAQHAEKIGADFFLLYFPERHYGDDNILNYFKSVASSAKIKILIHEMPMRSGYGGPNQQYSLELLNQLFKIENIVGLKEESLDAEYSNQIVEKFSESAIIIGAGGGMSRYLDRDFKRGSSCFLGGLGGFVPKLELQFFENLVSGNIENAKKIVEEIEKPYFKTVVPMGWHPSLKAALHLMGLMPKFERSPMKIMRDEEFATLKVTLQNNGWL